MGTEFLTLFIPVIPIFFIGCLWFVINKRKNLNDSKFVLFLLFLSVCEIIGVVYLGNLVQGLAVYGFLTFVVLILSIPVVILIFTREKRVKESQWSHTRSEKNESNT